MWTEGLNFNPCYGCRISSHVIQLNKHESGCIGTNSNVCAPPRCNSKIATHQVQNQITQWHQSKMETYSMLLNTSALNQPPSQKVCHQLQTRRANHFFPVMQKAAEKPLKVFLQPKHPQIDVHNLFTTRSYYTDQELELMPTSTPFFLMRFHYALCSLLDIMIIMLYQQLISNSLFNIVDMYV